MTLNKIDFGISLEQVLDYIEKISRIKLTLNTKNRLRNQVKSKPRSIQKRCAFSYKKG